MRGLRIAAVTAVIACLTAAQARAEGGAVTLHFFESAVCPVCLQAKKDLPGLRKKYPALNVIAYQVRNGRGQIDAANEKNISRLLNMLSSIDRKLNGRPFVIHDRAAHRFVLSGGVPYYEKKISATTTVRKEMGLPIFVLGDKALVGYNPFDLEREIRGLAAR